MKDISVTSRAAFVGESLAACDGWFRNMNSTIG
jgi:hypothetical protein